MIDGDFCHVPGSLETGPTSIEMEEEGEKLEKNSTEWFAILFVRSAFLLHVC